MLLLESVYLILGVLAVYAFSEAKRLGLLEEMPYDRDARARLRSGQLLGILKSKLSNVELIQIHPDKVIYRSLGDQYRLWFHEDSLLFQGQYQEVEVLHQFEQGEQVEFRQEGCQISIEVSSPKDSRIQSSFALRLPLALRATPTC